jgi:hypothetical protein
LIAKGKATEKAGGECYGGVPDAFVQSLDAAIENAARAKALIAQTYN